MVGSEGPEEARFFPAAAFLAALLSTASAPRIPPETLRAPPECLPSPRAPAPGPGDSLPLPVAVPERGAANGRILPAAPRENAQAPKNKTRSDCRRRARWRVLDRGRPPLVGQAQAPSHRGHKRPAGSSEPFR